MKIRYFAWLREAIGTSSEDLTYNPDWKNVADLVKFLRAQSTAHHQVLEDMTLVRVAVNYDYVDLDHPLTASDEVAFFPPVTGG